MLFCVYVHGLTPMKKTSSFFVNCWFIWISTIINNLNYILIDLSTMGHEYFEVWIGNISIGHDLVWIPLHYTLNLYVFKLHITYCNRHHLVVKKIIHMACDCCPTLDMLYMIKHDPNGLDITFKLHPLD